MNEIVANDKLGAFCRHTHVEVKGAAQRPARRPHLRGEGHLRHRRPEDRLRQSRLAAHARAGGAHRARGAAAARCRRARRRQDAHRGDGVEPDRRERALRHAGQRQRAGPRAGRLVERLGGGGGGGARGFRDRQRHRRLGAAARRAIAASSACGPPTGASRSRACARSRRASIPAAGSRATPAVFERVGPRAAARRRAGARAAAGCSSRRTRSRSPTQGAAAALEPALDKVAALLGKPERVTVGDEPLTQWMDYFRFPQGAEAWECHTRMGDAGEAAVRARRSGRASSGRRRSRRADVARARARREEITQRMDELLRGDAVLALPSVPGIAPLRGCLGGSDRRSCARRALADAVHLRARAAAAGLAAARDAGRLPARAFAHRRARQRHDAARAREGAKLEL